MPSPRYRSDPVLWLEGRFGWEFIIRLRNAFLSRALLALSLTAFLLASFGGLDWVVAAGLWKARLVLAGSALFLAGHLYSLLRTPPEFRTGSSIPDLVGQMLNITSAAYLEDQVGRSRSLLARMRAAPPGDMPVETFYHLEDLLDSSPAAGPPRADAGSFYDADLRLREWDRPADRALCLGLFGAGLLLLGAPTLLALATILP